MLKDRGTKKWVAMMLPEHVQAVREEIENQNKIKRPILDEDKIAEIEILIHEAMEFNWTLSYEIFEDGYIKTITGKTVFVDYINKHFRIQDEKEYNYQIPFYKLVNVSKIY